MWTTALLFDCNELFETVLIDTKINKSAQLVPQLIPHDSKLFLFYLMISHWTIHIFTYTKKSYRNARPQTKQRPFRTREAVKV